MTIKNIEDRLKIAEDTLAILNMHNEYLFCLNNCRWEDIPGFFAEDAVINIHGIRKGRAEIHKYFLTKIPKLNTGENRDSHFAVQPVVKLDGNTAKSHWLMYIMITDPVNKSPLRWISGRYDCEYCREKGEWKFSSLIFTSPWPAEVS